MMRRRQFLTAAALSPWWLRRAFADVSVPAEDADHDGLGEGLRRARRSGRPLLVLVVPTGWEARWDRGRAFGELLNHGSDEQLWPLAMVEVAAVPIERLRRELAVAGEPLMVVVDGPRVRPLDAPLPRHAHRARVIVIGQPPPPPEEEVSRERIAVLARLLRQVAPPTAPTPAEQARLVAERVAPELRRRPPPGSHWGTSSGCATSWEPTPTEAQRKAEEEERRRREREAARRRGEPMTIEFDPVVSIGCGMGHVPEKARRFLGFYVQESG
jgi:hypothetical protein